MVQPLLVEIIGEAESGKTHNSSSMFPQPAHFDTSPKQEAKPIIRKLFPEDWKKRYFTVRMWEDLMSGVKAALERDDVKTIVIDTSADLQDLAAKHWLKEKGKDAVYPITQYAHVRDKVDELIDMVARKEKNLVFTAGMKDEWVGKGTDAHATGRRIREGFARSPKACDIRIYLYLEEIWQCPNCKNTLKLPTGQSGLKCTPCGKDFALIGVERANKMVKNRFVDRAGKNWVESLKKLDYQTLMESTTLPKEEWIT